MRLNTKYSIALHCLIFIEEYQSKTKVTSELLAKSTGCNSSAIRAILNTLQKADIISVKRGVGGAYLNRDPRDLNIWEIYKAIEPNGLKNLIGLHPNPSEKCPVGNKIRTVLEEPYVEVGEALRVAMEDISLQHIIDNYHKEEENQ